VVVAEGSRLLAIAADLHRAPGARAVAGLVVEGDAAGLVAARLQPLPLVSWCELSDGGNDAPERAAGSVVLGSEHGSALVEPDAEARPAPRFLQRLRGGFGVRLDAVVGEEEVTDRLAYGDSVGEFLVGWFHQIVDQTLLGEPHGQLVRRRDRVDPCLEIER